MEFTAQQIATYLGGSVEGNAEATVKTFAKIEEGEAGAISFLANPKYAHYLYETASSVVLVNRDFVLEGPVSATLVRVDNAYEAIARLLSLYESMTQKRSGVHPLACVEADATLGDDVYVGPFCLHRIGRHHRIGFSDLCPLRHRTRCPCRRKLSLLSRRQCLPRLSHRQ